MTVSLASYYSKYNSKLYFKANPLLEEIVRSGASLKEELFFRNSNIKN